VPRVSPDEPMGALLSSEAHALEAQRSDADEAADLDDLAELLGALAARKPLVAHLTSSMTPATDTRVIVSTAFAAELEVGARASARRSFWFVLFCLMYIYAQFWGLFCSI